MECRIVQNSAKLERNELEVYDCKNKVKYERSAVEELELLVFTYHVIKPKNRNHSINKVTNKGCDR